MQRLFQKLLEKINVIEEEKDDITKKLQEQIVSLENEYEVCIENIRKGNLSVSLFFS